VLEYLDNFHGEKHAFVNWDSDETGIIDLKSGELMSFAEAENLKFNYKHRPAEDEVNSSSKKIKLAIASDWGTGTRESAAVAANMELFNADYTMHMGDVYYEALENEIDTNLLGKNANDNQHGTTFPRGTKNSFFLNANHEMLSLGNAFFDHLLAKNTLNQKASYFSLENEYWRLIALDTGYDCYESFAFIDAINEVSERSEPSNTIHTSCH